ncbi:MAG: hypothetical protein ACXWC5_30690 [Burkholderiales bacterium]
MTIRVSVKVSDWANTQLNAEEAEAHALAASRKRSVQKTLAETERELATLLSLRVRQLISDAEFVSERNKLEQSRIKLEQQLQNDEADTTFEPVQALISFSKRALDWFRAGDWEAKRLIFDSVCSNPRLKDRILSGEARKPFHSILNCDTILGLCGLRHENLTASGCWCLAPRHFDCAAALSLPL